MSSNSDLLKKYKSLFSTTLSTGIGTGTSDTLTPATVTGLPTDTAITLTIDRVDSGAVATPSKLERIVGVISGGNLGSYVRAKDGTTEQAHTAGAVVEMVWNSQDWNDMIDWGLTEHNQDGTHSAITATTVTATGAIEGASLELASGATITAILDEDTMSSNSATAVPTQQSVKAYVDANAGGGDWTEYTAVTPTTGTLDDPTFPIVFAGVDLTSTLAVGMRVKITQGTVKYFIITAIAFSTNTTVTLYGGTDYDLVESGTTAISAFEYSSAKAPIGFPLDPTKWTVTVTDTGNRVQSSPTQNTWYNLNAAHQIIIPIGVWNTLYFATPYSAKTGTEVLSQVTLSTANNSASDSDFTVQNYLQAPSGAINISVTSTKSKILSLASKTTYYLNARTTVASATNLGIDGSVCATVIRAVCSYL